ncbi:MAG: SAM-dependent methyltransferase [Roseiflexaceae bacterium]
MTIPEPATTAESPPLVIEPHRRFSESRLWAWQRAFFERRGAAAWNEAQVPHYITSNPAMAAAYARLIAGFLRDWRTALDPDQPVYLLELGGGSGRFAYHLLTRLHDLLERTPLRGLRVVYVLSDAAPAVIEAWRAHPWLQPLVAEGRLDFALFDAAAPAPLRLLSSGLTLTPETCANPLVALANYVFDSIPQDLFAVQGGQLSECLAALTLPEPPAEPDDPALLGRVGIAIERRLATKPCYDDPHWNSILAGYRERLGDAVLAFPCAALGCLRFLHHLAGGRLLLLSADKGYRSEDEIEGRQEPALALHGSFSMSVNYHAIGAYARLLGGAVLQTSHQPAHLHVVGLLFGQPPDGSGETELAYYEAVERGGPDDFFALKKGIEPHYAALSLAQILAYLRLSGWDSNIFWGCLPSLLARAAEADAGLRAELCAAAAHVWAGYFPIGEADDLAFHIGMLLYALGAYPQALRYWQYSLRLYGPHPSTTYNLAMTAYQLHQREVALTYLEQTLALHPTFAEARAMRIAIESERARLAHRV